MRIVVTGTLKDNIGRDDFMALVNEAGGKVVISLSKTTSFVLVASKPGHSKIAKARELEVEIIGEDRGRNALHPLNS